MAVKNQTIIVQGGSGTFDIFLHSYDGGPLVDADTVPTYVIKDPTGATVYSDTSTRISVGYYTATYSASATATISTLWSVVWNITLNGILVSDSSELFIVLAPGTPSYGPTITIEDKWMNQIKTIIGYPKVTKLILTDSEIKDLCIEPALREYFKKFPKRDVYEQWISRDTVYTIPFPDAYTFGVLDAKITDRRTATVGSQSSFWELIKFQQFGGSNITLYGIKGFNPSALRQANLTQFQSLNAYRKTYKTEFLDISLEDEEIRVYTNQEGTIQIDWAKFTNDFADVRYQQIKNVIKLAQAYILRQASDMVGLMTDSGLEITMNPDVMITRAEKLEADVFEEWNEIADIIVIKQ